MTDEKELTAELKKLNNNLSELKNSGKYLVYSANPFKFGLFNFIAGIFHVLGRIFGYLAVFGALVYFLSQYNLTSMISKWMENTLQQVRWEQIIMPETQTEQLQNVSPEQIQELQRQLSN
jgi:hypothetical protein